MDWFLYDNGLRHERVKRWSSNSAENFYKFTYNFGRLTFEMCFIETFDFV